MKKIIILFVIGLTLITDITAQKKSELYIFGTFNTAGAKISPTSGTTISRNLGGGIGIQAIMKLTKNFSLVTQPVFQGRGYTSSIGSNKYDISATYVDVPVDLEYGFGLPKFLFGNVPGNNYFFGAGVYGGFALGGKYVDKYTNDPSVKMKFGESATDNRSATDYGLNLVAGMSIRDWGFGKHKTSLRCGIQKQVGYKNVIPSARQTNGQEIKLTNFSMFVAIKI